jgi:hypothetical protein
VHAVAGGQSPLNFREDVAVHEEDAGLGGRRLSSRQQAAQMLLVLLDVDRIFAVVGVFPVCLVTRRPTSTT